MNPDDILKTLKDAEAAFRSRGVAHAASFGSVARGDAGPDSDIDVMVEIAPEAELDVYANVGIVNQIEDLFAAQSMSRTARRCGPMFARTPNVTPSMPSYAKTYHALFDIRDNIVLARQFVDGLTFEVSRLHFYATTRALEIISEAARQLPQELREQHPDVPWRSIMGAGTVYRHDYDGVATAAVWRTVQTNLAALLDMVSREIEALDAP